MPDKYHHKQTYENSLKYDRDMENSLDLQYKTGRKEEKLEIAQSMILDIL